MAGESEIMMNYRLHIEIVLKKVKLSHYRPMGPRGFWEVKASRFHDIGT
jgi:hypothetical protein